LNPSGVLELGALRAGGERAGPPRKTIGKPLGSCHSTLVFADNEVLDSNSGRALIPSMARALRIQHPGGRCPVTTRGNERKNVFRDDTDGFRFLELLSGLSERFGTRIHAYVLMDNHYHLLLETPEPNLSQTMQWST
jgi:Transposase IS200 like